jgi:WD40 repeat protein
MSTGGTKPYHAFISYSHAGDRALAEALQRALHRFSKRWYQRRALRTFRDETHLSATPELWATIKHALSQSSRFILLASPKAAASRWVRDEIAWWLEHRSIDTLLIAVTDGMIRWDPERCDFDWSVTTALPQMLQGRFRQEPLYVELAWARTRRQRSLDDRRFTDHVASLAAPLHGKSKDELIGEDLREHRRTLRIALAAVVLIASLAMVAAGMALIAEQRRKLALGRQLAAQSLTYQRDRPDLALLLSVAAQRWADTIDVRASLLGALENQPQLLGFLPGRGSYYDIAFGSDGRVLLTGGLYGRAQLWDIPRRKLLNVVGSRISNNTAQSVAVDADRRLVVFGSHDGLIEVWDLRNGKRPLRSLRAHDSSVSLALSPEAALLASTGYDGGIALWRLPGATEWRRIDDTAVHSPTLDPSGRRLATTSDAKVFVRDLETGERISWRAVTRPPVSRLTFSPNGELLAGIDANEHQILLWDVAHGKQHGPALRGHTFVINDLAFSPDGQRLASAGDDNRVLLWDLRKGGEKPEPLTLRDHTSGVNSVAFSPDGRLLASASDRIMLTELGRWSRIGRRLGGSSVRTGSIDLTTDGMTLVSVGDSGLLVRDLSKPSGPRRIGPPRGGWSLAVDAGRNLAAWGGGNDWITLWDLDSGERVRRIRTGYRFNMGAIAFSPDGRKLASTGNNAVHVWDVGSGEPLAADLKGHTGWVTALAWTPDGQILASGGAGGVILWNTRTWKPRGRIDETAQVMALSPDGALLAIAYYQRLSLWDLESSRPVQADLTGHSGSISAIAFDPAGELMATAGSGGDILLWDLGSGQALGRLRGPGGRIYDLAYSHDGEKLLAAGEDGILLWEVSPTAWTRLACRVANRDLTEQEWRSFLPDEPYTRICSRPPAD